MRKNEREYFKKAVKKGNLCIWFYRNADEIYYLIIVYIHESVLLLFIKLSKKL